jgi:hypothetical protein
MDDFLFTCLPSYARDPSPLLGRDMLAYIRTTILMAPGQLLCLPVTETHVDPEVWSTQGKIVQLILPC